MTTYTNAEVDAVALAMVSDDRGYKVVAFDGSTSNANWWRRQARAALAARDALFEVAEERWHVEWPETTEDDAPMRRSPRPLGKDEAALEVELMRADGFVGVHVVHVTTKRRKR